MSASTFDVTERSSALYTATLVDEAGDAVERDAIDSLRLWLYEVRSNTIINSRDNQDVLAQGSHGVTFADGVVSWQLSPDDNAIVRATQQPVVEYHEAVFAATWSGGARGKTWKVSIRVSNLTPVPATV